MGYLMHIYLRVSYYIYIRYLYIHAPVYMIIVYASIYFYMMQCLVILYCMAAIGDELTSTDHETKLAEMEGLR